MTGASRVGVSILTSALALAAGAVAQNIGDPGAAAPPAPAAPAPAAPAPAEPSAPSQPTQTVTTTYRPIGVPAPGYDINPGLPSSSRPTSDTSRSGDTFDLVGPSGQAQTARGDANASGVLGKRTSTVPNVHQVKRGDTLWDLCGSYFNNPWAWPKVWSYNPQIQNPHWIYPGDQLRMRTDTTGGGGGGGGGRERTSIVLGGGPGGQQPGGGFIDRRSRVPHETVFLRDVGYIDDPKKDVWGELVGAEEEQMLLTQGNNAYVIMRPGVDLKLGQLLTVFRSVRTPPSVPGARKPKGEIIAFKGTVKIDQWNPKTRVGRGRLIESLDVVERGDKLGPVGRRFEVVPPRRNETDTEARVLATIYPHEVIGQNQVVFIDKGSKDGLAPGNRLFVLRRGDAWRRSLATTTTMARTRVHLDVPEHVATDVTPLEGNTKDFPDEVVGEVRVLRVDPESSAALVTASKVDLQVGERLVARRGY